MPEVAILNAVRKDQTPIFLMFAWLKAGMSDAQFEEHVPLQFCAQSLHSRGSHSNLTILFLGGMECLTDQYKQGLVDLGLELVDAHVFYENAEARFPALKRFNNYEIHCFLRWIVLQNYVQSRSITQQILHFDGDVVFGADLDDIATDLKGRTFVLQGCPAVSSICNYEWFSNYATELESFCANIECYSQIAWQHRDGYNVSASTKWSGHCWFRKVISSDQDLISYLIHADLIVQERPKDMIGTFQLYYMQNPMWIQYYHGGQLSQAKNLKFTSIGRDCYIDGKKIALWHFQSDFSLYLNFTLLSHRFRLPFRSPNQIDHPRWMLLFRAARKYTRFSRLSLYRGFIELNPDQSAAKYRFTDVFNARRHWEKSAFSKD